MPRKPSSIWVIVESPNQTIGSASGQYVAQRIELLNREPEQATEQFLHSAANGSTAHIIEDTKVKTYRVRTALEEVDDARIGHDEDDADPSVSRA